MEFAENSFTFDNLLLANPAERLTKPGTHSASYYDIRITEAITAGFFGISHFGKNAKKE